MNKSNIMPMFQALMAALLFGASAPIAKLFLGNIQPIPLAAFLYLGSGLGLLVLLFIQNLTSKDTKVKASIKKEDIGWLIGAIFAGGVIAPIILMSSLKNTPASTASLLLTYT